MPKKRNIAELCINIMKDAVFSFLIPVSGAVRLKRNKQRNISGHPLDNLIREAVIIALIRVASEVRLTDAQKTKYRQTMY